PTAINVTCPLFHSNRLLTVADAPGVSAATSLNTMWLRSAEPLASVASAGTAPAGVTFTSWNVLVALVRRNRFSGPRGSPGTRAGASRARPLPRAPVGHHGR